MGVTFLIVAIIITLAVRRIAAALVRIDAHNRRFAPEPGSAVELELREALKGLYALLPRGSCKAGSPDGCPVCVARELLSHPPG